MPTCINVHWWLSHSALESLQLDYYLFLGLRSSFFLKALPADFAQVVHSSHLCSCCKHHLYSEAFSDTQFEVAPQALNLFYFQLRTYHYQIFFHLFLLLMNSITYNTHLEHKLYDNKDLICIVYSDIGVISEHNRHSVNVYWMNTCINVCVCVCW